MTEAPLSLTFKLGDTLVTARGENPAEFEQAVEYALQRAGELLDELALLKAKANLALGGVKATPVEASSNEDKKKAERWDWKGSIDPWPSDQYGPFVYREGSNNFGPYAMLCSAGGKDAPGAKPPVFSKGKPKY